MPLKYSTETFLVLLLGAAIIITGIVTAILPPLSVTVIPWVIAFVASLLYPLALYPLFKDRRADYEFRALHFVPAFMLIVWLGIQLLLSVLPFFEVLLASYTWGWSLFIVATAFILLILFCLRVLRQRVPRLTVLMTLFLPFLVLGILSERNRWDNKLAELVWNDPAGSGAIIASNDSSQGDLERSPDEDEEQWRARLRAVEDRSRKIETGASLRDLILLGVHGAKDGVTAASNGMRETLVAQASSSSAGTQVASSGSSSSKPPVLATSGLGVEHMAIVFAALYCGFLHRRLKRYA